MIAFLSGFAYELTYLAWIYFANRGWPFRTAGMSMLVGCVSLMGIGTAVRDPGQAPWLICGYGVGSFVAAKWKARQVIKEATRVG